MTTVVAGNCGFSIAPIRPDGVSLLARTLQHVEDMSFDTLAVGVPWDEFETFPQYLDAVERRGVVAQLRLLRRPHRGAAVRHGRGRLRARRPPTDELGRMQAVVAEAMAAGAIGFASSASPTHNGDGGRPVPSRVADLDELRALLEPVQRRRARAWSPCSRAASSPTTRCSSCSARSGGPFTWTALLTVKGYPYHEKVMAEHDAAWADGVEVWPQVSCRPLVFQMNLAEPFTLNMRPSFAALMGTRPRGAHGRLPRPGVAGDGLGGRLRARRAASRSTGRRCRWPSRASHPELVDRAVVDLAEERGCTPLDVMLDVSLDDDLESRFWSVLANDDPDAIAWLLPRDNVLLGLADSGAHVSQLCDACFATDLLGNWVRDRGVMPLERAVHKLTGEPAGVYGLTDRGTRRGRARPPTCACSTPTPSPRARCAASATSRPTASASPPTQPVGMTHVLVNGVPIRVDGEAVPDGLDSRPGQVAAELRSQARYDAHRRRGPESASRRLVDPAARPRGTRCWSRRRTLGPAAATDRSEARALDAIVHEAVLGDLVFLQHDAGECRRLRGRHSRRESAFRRVDPGRGRRKSTQTSRPRVDDQAAFLVHLAPARLPRSLPVVLHLAAGDRPSALVGRLEHEEMPGSSKIRAPAEAGILGISNDVVGTDGASVGSPGEVPV